MNAYTAALKAEHDQQKKVELSQFHYASQQRSTEVLFQELQKEQVVLAECRSRTDHALAALEEEILAKRSVRDALAELPHF